MSALGHVDIRVTHVVPHNLALRLRVAYGWNAWCGSFKNALYLLESAESESLLQKLFANIRGQSDFRMRTCDLCNRLAYTFTTITWDFVTNFKVRK
ncbi:MAG: hypothetical protein WBV77_09300 [Solirubrobacteraceae bacterium]